jgi:LmbE family N-acetylglucosaminyl deacetylase
LEFITIISINVFSNHFNSITMIIRFIKTFYFYSLLLLIEITIPLSAQPGKMLTSGEIKSQLKKLNVLGSVLYIAAHPDDENTALLSYFSSGKSLHTGYLSMTRGDGGQNLIGSEQGELLGLIRTQELLDARKIDGAEQYFTRAYDFGFSKSPDETFTFWGKEKVLSDVVWIIRKFRPDVILTRFPITGEGGHGHHTASAILAEEAFHQAGDPSKFPEQLKYLKPWQPKRLLWNAWLPIIEKRKEDTSNLPKLDVGEFNPYLGKSYTEIAAESRSMHKSQGFGTGGTRGESIQYFEPRDGTPVKSDLFEDIDLSWRRVKGSNKLSDLLSKAEQTYNPDKPEEVLPLLIDAYKEMDRIEDDHWIPIKRAELKEVIGSLLGLWTEGISNVYSTVSGQAVSFTASIVNRINYPIILKSISYSFNKDEQNINAELSKGKSFQKSFTVTIPNDAPLSQPYWLANEHSNGTFIVNNQELVGKAENDPSAVVNFIIDIKGCEITFTTPLLYKWIDPIRGEKYRSLEILPAVSINFEDKVYLFPDNNSKTITVHLINNSSNLSGKLKLSHPDGWKVTPEEASFAFGKKDEGKLLEFSITPPAESSEMKISAEAFIGNSKYDMGITRINYDHIPIQTYLPKAEIKVVRFSTAKTISNIGYIMGSGDDIPDFLTQLGYNITLLSDNDLVTRNLSGYDAIIAGVRVYNTKKLMAHIQDKLLDYISNGGNYIVQYTVNRDIVVPSIGPYPINISTDRVTNEEAKINFIDTSSFLLKYPNKITQNDFSGWIQERGLYFADKWDSHYRSIISCSDEGEKPIEGGLLISKYGKGNYIYTGLSFFREVPAGVPGAIRLFINLLSPEK